MSPASPDFDDDDLVALSRLLDDELTGHERRSLETRLAAEPDLQRLLAVLNRAGDVLRAPVEPPAPEVVDAQIRAALEVRGHTAPATVVPINRRRPALALTLAAAALVLVVGALALRPGAGRKDDVALRTPLAAETEKAAVAAPASADGPASAAVEAAGPEVTRYDDLDALIVDTRRRTSGTKQASSADLGATGPTPRAPALIGTRDPTCGTDLAESARVADRAVRWGIRLPAPGGEPRLVVVDVVSCAVLADQPW